MAAAQRNFGPALKHWRRERGKTQLELAMIAGYSQRHVSFLESGRSRPSRTTVIVLAEALDVPIKERNGLLNAAGFAPAYSSEAIDSSALAPAIDALDVVLESHRPFPAIVVDRGWNTYAGNDNAFALFSTFLADPSAMLSTPNAMQLCLDTNGLRPFIVNWREFTASLLVRLRHELAFDGEDATLRALVDKIEADEEFTRYQRASDAPASPVATLSLARDGKRIDLFTLISSFGTPTDATLAELRVETFFPANARSRTILESIDADLSSANPSRATALPLAAWRNDLPVPKGTAHARA